MILNGGNKKEKIKIGFLVGTLNYGGAQKLILDIIKKINKEIFEPYLIFWRKGKFYNDFLEIKSLKIIQLKHKPKYIKSNFVFKFPTFIKQQIELRKLVAKEKLMIIHSHLRESDIHNFFLKRNNINLKIISTRHNTEVKYQKKKIFRPLYNLVNSKFNYIICCSKNVKKSFLKYEFIKNLSVIYNGVSLEEIKLNNTKTYDFINKNEINIISVGRLEKVKGFNHLIKTFEIFYKSHPNSNLFICGDGTQKTILMNFVKSMNLEQKVHFLGQRNDIYSLLKNCDVFILLSNREGLPISVLEAMACKIPIIGSKIEGIEEIIQNGMNGYLVNRFDYDSIAKLIDKLKIDKSLREKVIKFGYNTIKSKFEINKTIKEYEKLYLKILRNN